jgi:hypothetical protein
VAKYRYIALARFKHDLSTIKNRPIKILPTPTKRNTDSFRGITEHIKTKNNTQNTTPNEKHPRRAAKNALQAPITSAEYIRTHHQKEKAPQSEKTPCKA